MSTRSLETADLLAWSGLTGYLLFVLFLDHEPAWTAQPWYYRGVLLVTLGCTAALWLAMLRHAWHSHMPPRRYYLLAGFVFLSALTAYWYYFQVYQPGRGDDASE